MKKKVGVTGQVSAKWGRNKCPLGPLFPDFGRIKWSIIHIVVFFTSNYDKKAIKFIFMIYFLMVTYLEIYGGGYFWNETRFREFKPLHFGINVIIVAHK